jgi:tetratricopeptide (TPR) repeat protein
VQVREAQRKLQAIVKTWTESFGEGLDGAGSSAAIFASLVEKGVVRQLASEATGVSQVDAIAAPVLLSQPFQLRKRLARWVHALKQSGEYGSRRHFVQPPEISQPRPPLTPRFSRPPVSNKGARDRALAQVKHATELFIEGKVEQAWKVVDELVESQTDDRTDANFVVRSLCNIASQLRRAGLKPIAGQCIAKATEFPAGADAKLYFDIATFFRDDWNFEKAREYYRKSREIAGDDYARVESAFRGEVHILSMLGRYAEAIDAYKELPNWEADRFVRTAIADLQRKSGQIAEAREEYQRLARQYEGLHRAHVGLAEVAKQAGKVHVAIERYNAVIRNFRSNLDPRDLVVYESARAHVLNLSRQYGQAERYLREALKASPRDSSLHLQMAKALRGQKKFS